MEPIHEQQFRSWLEGPILSEFKKLKFDDEGLRMLSEQFANMVKEKGYMAIEAKELVKDVFYELQPTNTNEIDKFVGYMLACD